MAALVISISSEACKESVVSSTSPTGVLDLVDYSSSSSDSDLPDDLVPPAPELPPVSPKLASRPSSSFGFPISPVITLPGNSSTAGVHGPTREAVPLSATFRTINGQRNSASLYSSSTASSSSDSLSDLSLVHSLDFDTPGQTQHGLATRVASPRLVYPPVRVPHHSEAFRR
ncbi:hypothetical protein Tco_0688066 [Tanacetum coccineum]